MKKDNEGHNTQVWYTPFPSDSMNVAPVTYEHANRDVRSKQSGLFSNPKGPWPDDVPRPVFNLKYRNPLGKNTYRPPDMFRATNAMVVSERVRDLLSDFDMGMNELLEVPIFEQNREIRIPGRWFALRVLERKAGINTDESDTGTEEWMKPPSGDHVLMLRIGKRGTKGWGLRVGYGDKSMEGIAVSREAATGADLWVDSLFTSIGTQAYFVTDRLHAAFVNAKLRVKSLHFAPTIMVGEGG